MWCVTGIPGSGKSTMCKLLNERGIRCINALDFPGSNKCRESDEVDIDCLRRAISGKESDSVVEGHFSHLLDCDSVIILERDEEAIGKTLEARRYSPAKIRENMDVMRSDVIYREALERLPAGRIHRIVVKENCLEEALSQCVDLILRSKNKD